MHSTLHEDQDGQYCMVLLDDNRVVKVFLLVVAKASYEETFATIANKVAVKVLRDRLGVDVLDHIKLFRNLVNLNPPGKFEHFYGACRESFFGRMFLVIAALCVTVRNVKYQ